WAPSRTRRNPYPFCRSPIVALLSWDCAAITASASIRPLTWIVGFRLSRSASGFEGHSEAGSRFSDFVSSFFASSVLVFSAFGCSAGSLRGDSADVMFGVGRGTAGEGGGADGGCARAAVIAITAKRRPSIIARFTDHH